MNHFFVSAMLTTLTFTALAHATDRQVPSQYPTIQSAINACVNGDRVMIAPGTYSGGLTITNKSITLSGTSAVRSDVHLLSSGTTLTMTSTTTHAVTLAKLFVRDSTRGVYAENIDLTINDCAFANFNNPSGNGGCVQIKNRSLVAQNSHFSNGRAAWGGGVYVGFASATLSQCVIEGNTAVNAGAGGFVQSGSSLRLLGCHIASQYFELGISSSGSYGQNRMCASGWYGTAVTDEGGNINLSSCADCDGQGGPDIIGIGLGNPDCDADLVPDHCDTPCPAVEWSVPQGGNGHWYQRIPRGTLSWQHCRDAAIAAGGDLASITSAAEENVIAPLIPSPVWGGYWNATYLGGSQPVSSPPSIGWAWTDGSPWKFTNWQSNQPDGGEGYLGIYRLNDGTHDVRWGDWPATDGGVYYYMLEWSADCNGDGVVDYGQILSGQFADTNGNGVPDTCENFVPIHQFDFDTDLHDSVGAATGQFIGNCRVENGALIADGNSSYVQFDQYLIPSTGSVTVAMWVKSEPGQGIHEFISQGTYNGSFYVGRNFMATDRFRVGDDWMQTNTPYDWICGAWHHVAVVVNRSTDRTQLWVDAQLQEERIGAISITSVGTGTKTRLCEQHCCGEFFRGKLDQLRIYSSALTGPTLAEIMATSGYPCSGDISGNNKVDGVDLSVLLGVWGTDGSGGEFDADVTNDGIVNGADLTIILGGWGPCPN